MMRTVNWHVATSVVTVCILSGSPKTVSSWDALDTDTVRERLNQRVPELLQQLNVPGLAIAVVDASGLKLVDSFGYVDASGSQRVRGDTVFQGASLGKPLFSYTLMVYEGDPRFELDIPVEDYLGERIAPDSLSATITARQLLSHSSGLAFSEADQRRQVVFTPGSEWQYSGLGYSVLQQAVELHWRKPLERLVSETLTGPLGMESTHYFPPNDAVSVALGHNRQGRAIEQMTWSAPSAASSLYTTAIDYGRFLSVMLAGSVVDEHSVPAQIVDPQIEVDASLGLCWGLGCAVAQEADDTIFFHWGSNPGYKSLALGSLAQDIAMVILTNGDNGLEVATELVATVFGRNYSFLRFYMLHPDD